MSSISSILEGLNHEQQQVVLARDGAFLVVAGAGTGKTTALTRRAAALIKEGVPASNILLLTFTRASAAEMISRAKKLVPEAVDISGGTFHSIAQRLVKENASVFRLPERPTILDPADTIDVFRKIAKKHGRKGGDNTPTPGILSKAHSFAVNTRRDLDDVVWDKWEEFGHAMDFFTKCIADYKEYKRDRAMFDFDDLLLAWDRMLDHPAIGKAIRERFPYVQVDEYQDCNALNVSIVTKLGGDNPNVAAVGDPAQAIYGFRGTAPGTMFAFMEHWPQAKQIFLTQNYRSTPDILSVGNAVDRSMRERFPRELKSMSTAASEDPLFVTVADEEQEAIFIADKVLENKSNGIPLSEQAVLVRSMNCARFIEGEFISRKIPYKVMGGIKLEEAKHIKDFMCLARVAVNQHDEVAWLRVLTMADGIGDTGAQKVIDAIRSTPLAMGDPGPIIMKAGRNKGKDGRGEQQLRDILGAWQVLAAGGPPADALDRALGLMDNIFQFRYPDDWKMRRRDIETVSAMAAQHPDLDTFLTTLALDYKIDKSSEKTGPVTEQEDPVTISTVHSAKGLEWDAVFFPTFTADHIPSRMANTPDEVEEEKRVLYVAMTRPRKKLCVIRPTTTAAKGYFAQESQFQSTIIPYFDKIQVGQRRQPASFRLQEKDDYHIDMDW
jgi:Superfamily I DNA and RNA helicases